MATAFWKLSFLRNKGLEKIDFERSMMGGAAITCGLYLRPAQLLLLANSRHWLSDVVNSRYAPESCRSLSVNIHNLTDRNRPITELGYLQFTFQYAVWYDPQ
jgi:hypothetical protein